MYHSVILPSIKFKMFYSICVPAKYSETNKNVYFTNADNLFELVYSNMYALSDHFEIVEVECFETNALYFKYDKTYYSKLITLHKKYNLANYDDFVYICENISNKFYNIDSAIRWKHLSVAKKIAQNNISSILKIKAEIKSLLKYAIISDDLELLKICIKHTKDSYESIDCLAHYILTNKVSMRILKELFINNHYICFRDLCYLCEAGNVEILNSIVNNYDKQTCDFYFRNHKQSCCLWSSAIYGGVLEVLDILKQQKVPIEKISNVISYACNVSRINILDWLKKYISSYDKDYVFSENVSLTTASNNGHIEVFKWFKKNKYVINDVNECFIESCKTGNIELLNWLETNYKIDLNEEMLKESSLHNKLNVLIRLYSNFKDFNYYFTENVTDEASRGGNIDILNWFLHIFPKNIKYTKKSIMYASSEGHVNVLDWFVNITNTSKKYTFLYDNDALILASKNGHINVLKWFYANIGAEIFTQELIKQLLHITVTHNQVDVITWLNDTFRLNTMIDFVLKDEANEKSVDYLSMPITVAIESATRNDKKDLLLFIKQNKHFFENKVCDFIDNYVVDFSI